MTASGGSGVQTVAASELPPQARWLLQSAWQAPVLPHPCETGLSGVPQQPCHVSPSSQHSPFASIAASGGNGPPPSAALLASPWEAASLPPGESPSCTHPPQPATANATVRRKVVDLIVALTFRHG
jgi:hypothetical protein